MSKAAHIERIKLGDKIQLIVWGMIAAILVLPASLSGTVSNIGTYALLSVIKTGIAAILVASVIGAASKKITILESRGVKITLFAILTLLVRVFIIG